MSDIDNLADYREPTTEERYGEGDKLTLNRIYDLLKEKGYTLQYSNEGGSAYLVNGDRYMSAWPSTRGLELCLFDDFDNPFGAKDFDSVHGYVDAVITRFDELWASYQEWC